MFDTMYPQNIHIGRSVHITARVVILTHYLITDSDGINWRSGHVYIGDRTFIGTGTIISKDVRIGNNCIIGAGSVITKDIPDNEIWAGNPARFIKKRILNIYNYGCSNYYNLSLSDAMQNVQYLGQPDEIK